MARAFPDFSTGIASFGLPVIPGIVNLPPYQGKVWFVDATLGSDGNSGRTPARAVKTIQKAVNLAAAGDTIFVFSGTYAENVVVTSKNYLSIIGAVQGYGKPDIVPASGMALHVDNSQGFVAARLRFGSPGNLAALTATVGRLVRIEGNGFHIEDCVFDGDATLNVPPAAGADNANSVLLGLKGDATSASYTASEGRIFRCLFRGATGRALALETGEPPSNGVGSTDVEILHNRFIDNVGIDLISRASFAGGGAYSYRRVLIAGNWFMGQKNKTTWIDLTTSIDGAAAAQSGSIMDNFFQDDALDATKVKMVGTGVSFVGNYDSVGVQDGSAFD